MMTNVTSQLVEMPVARFVDGCRTFDRLMSVDPAPPCVASLHKDRIDVRPVRVFNVVREDLQMTLIPAGPQQAKVTREVSDEKIAAFLEDLLSTPRPPRVIEKRLAERSLLPLTTGLECKPMDGEQMDRFLNYTQKAAGHAVIYAALNLTGTVDELINLALLHCSTKDLGYIVYKANDMREDWGMTGDIDEDDAAGVSSAWNQLAYNRVQLVANAIEAWLADRV